MAQKDNNKDIKGKLFEGTKSENQKQESKAPYVNEKVKYYILGIAAVLVVVVVCLVLFGPEVKDENKPHPTATVVSNDNAYGIDDGKVYTPTFIYFVSKTHDGYEEYMKTVDELKSEYEDRVNFDLRDIDENPEEKDNFPLQDNVPLLIMLDTKNNMSVFEYTIDKATMKADIEKVLE